MGHVYNVIRFKTQISVIFTRLYLMYAFHCRCIYVTVRLGNHGFNKILKLSLNSCNNIRISWIFLKSLGSSCNYWKSLKVDYIHYSVYEYITILRGFMYYWNETTVISGTLLIIILYIMCNINIILYYNYISSSAHLLQYSITIHNK